MVRWRIYLLVTLCCLCSLAPFSPLAAAAPIIETFEATPTSWVLSRDISGTGTVTRSSTHPAAGSYSALLQTASNGSTAYVRDTFTSAATDHPWEERPGDWRWQRAMVYVPSSTVAALGSGEYFTVAGFWPSASPNGYGWYLRISQNGDMYLNGAYDSGTRADFSAYGKFPLNQWVNLEIGLHTQNGPGVKRAFAFLVNGAFYGWYRQGRMDSETYNRVGFGIVSTNSPDPLAVYVDQWRESTNSNFPDGSDTRSTTALQEQDFRNGSGVQVQYDWSTWSNFPVLDNYGVYATAARIQAGRNLDRMPSVIDGWGEIEIDWPNGTPPNCFNNYCAAMIGFRKDVNREENMEVIPYADGTGTFFLVFEAWVGSPVMLANWPMPYAAADPNRNVPEPGDIIRARWQATGATQLNVRASYYDASSNFWYTDVINWTGDASNISGINYFDGYHTASSITIDSIFYSIRRYKVGTLASYVQPPVLPLPAPDRNFFTTNQPTLTWSAVGGAVGYDIEVDDSSGFGSPAFSAYNQPASQLSIQTDTLSPGHYYWRVRARRANNVLGNWSAIDEFTISP